MGEKQEAWGKPDTLLSKQKFNKREREEKYEKKWNVYVCSYNEIPSEILTEKHWRQYNRV